MIRLEYIEVAYGKNRPVLTLESLDIARGDRVAIIGPSGAGKSTLLRSLKGFVKPRRGKVEVLGVNLTCASRRARREVNQRVALIYQQFHLVPRLSVLQNTLCGRLGHTSRWRSLFGWFTPEDTRVAWAAIVEVGLAGKVHQRADTLSGGEQQRVAVARALANNPSLLLADEPTAALDSQRGRQVMELFAKVAHERNAGVLVVTHDHRTLDVFDRILEVEDGAIRVREESYDCLIHASKRATG